MIFLLILAPVAITFLLIYNYLSKSYRYWRLRGIPQDKPFLFFGSFYEVLTRQHQIGRKVCEIYGKFSTSPYVGFYIFTHPVFMPRSPSLIKKILLKDFNSFQDRRGPPAVASNDPISYHSLFSSKGEYWKALRAKITPVFSSGKIKMMLPLLKECGQDLIDCLTEHCEIGVKNVEVVALTKRYAVDAICSCAFGFNSHSIKDKDSVVFEMASHLLNFRSLRGSIAGFAFFFCPKLYCMFNMTMGNRKASLFFQEMFQRTLRKREEQGIIRNDLIDLLNILKKNETIKDDFKFDDIKMAAQAITFFSAGYDSTSVTTALALYELALSTKLQDRLREELTEAFNEHGEFTYESIQEIKYLDMVVNEALRKYPFTAFLNREATSDYVDEETGLKIEKGTDVMIPVCALHYDPNFFPDPEKFDPERFNDQNKQNIVPYTFMPFGEGPRACIGPRYALLVVKLALAYAIKDFAFEPDETTPIPVILDPKSVLLHISDEGIPLRVSKIQLLCTN